MYIPLAKKPVEPVIKMILSFNDLVTPPPKSISGDDVVGKSEEEEEYIYISYTCNEIRQRDQ